MIIESEKRLKDLLIKIGIPEDKITKPDDDQTVIGTADFLVDNIVFEVKEIVPDKTDLKIIQEYKDDVAKRTVHTYRVPDKTSSFKNDVGLARKKFKKYPNHATVLVEDLTDWWWLEPDIEKMMFGTETIHIDLNYDAIIDENYTNRIVRLDMNRSIGCFIFITASDIIILHNLMAYGDCIMPLSYINRFTKITNRQYYFVNIPRSKALIRQIL